MAKNKTGLGRGLSSLMGVYEPSAPAAKPVEQPKKEEKPAVSNTVEEAPVRTQPQRTTNREVIREEDLAQEDRAVVNAEKHNAQAYSIASIENMVQQNQIPVRAAVAKQELIEENDGVTIKGVVERDSRQAAETVVVDKEEPASDPEPAQKVSANVDQRAARGYETSPSRVPAANPAPKFDLKEYVDTHNPKGKANAATTTGFEVDIEQVKPNPTQPRTHFNEEELDELSSSIAKDGLLQPILVREKDGAYEIIAGERRWQASKLAGLKKVPICIKNVDDDKVLELALIENLQRSDLNPIEEAYGYKRMMERGGKTQSEVAVAVSKGRSTIANALRLLELPEEAQRLLFEEKISAGHARAILAIPSEEGREKLTVRIVEEGLSVRDAENLARLMSGNKKKDGSKASKPSIPKAFRTTAKNLQASLGTKVRVRSVNGVNKLEIEFKDEEELQRLFELMHRE